ncbi:MAG TPA: hypothetical protein VFG51_04035 [Candidatus Saccharimonadia bacterium]|nr:hypothetical protein [Candidatus Saccharimonadia bacterium]
MTTKNRQHTIELWFHPVKHTVQAIFTHKDWYWEEYSDESALKHYRMDCAWGRVHILVFGWEAPLEWAVMLTTMVIQGDYKSVKFDEICGTALAKKGK